MEVRPGQKVNNGDVNVHLVYEGGRETQVQGRKPTELVHGFLVQNDILEVEGATPEGEVCALQIRDVLLESALDGTLYHILKHYNT